MPTFGCGFSIFCVFASRWWLLASVGLLTSSSSFVGGALGACIKFYQRMGTKEQKIDRAHGAKGKIWSFIGILLFQILQDILFGVLNGKLFSPTKTVTYNDINFGLPALLTCVESVVFSLVFHWTYSAKEYHEGQRLDRFGSPVKCTGTARAILDALNLSDVIAGTILAFQLLFLRLSSRYGSSSGQQRVKGGADDVGMEPLAHPHRGRGYTGQSEVDEDPPLGSEHESGAYDPAFPQPARSLGEHEYQPLTRPWREPSPSGMGKQHPRQMV
ncbi:hypothetical protein LTR53_015492 [Teratosphaeriaceae sp. CCFEE 6253]|nr:hypothetical protein LTR53_015492 [Teratosphaeriaceae sp. CCFEE 6253]